MVVRAPVIATHGHARFRPRRFAHICALPVLCSAGGSPLVELSWHLVRLRTGEDGWRICPASLTARVPGKLTLTV